MANFTWTFDAPTGVYKSHAMSQRLFEEAMQKTVFMDHVSPIDGFGRNSGESVTLTRVNELTTPTTGVISEDDRIPEDEFSMSTVAITVNEYGRSVPYTSLANDLSEFDVENPIQKALMNQMAKTMDFSACAAFKAAQVKYTPTGAAAGTFNTAGSHSTAASNLNFYHVEQIRDYMFDDLYTPMVGDSYVGIFRTQALRGIKRDPAYEEWHKYTNPQMKYNSEVGKLEDIRFIETNHGGTAVGSNGLNKNIGTGSVLGEGVVFGEDAVVMAEALTPELRAGMPDDFGRKKAVAWYGILEFGLVWDTGNAGEARVVHVGSDT